jgi:hypothetical protein
MGKWKQNQWTEEEVQFLLDNYNNGMWATEIGKHLGRSFNSVVRKWFRIKHDQSKRKTKPWTEEEVQFLLDHYNRMSPEEIATSLGRTKKSVILKKHNQLGQFEIIPDRERVKTEVNTTAERWTTKDADLLTTMYVDGRISELELVQTFPNRTIRQIRDKAARLKLTGKYGKRNCKGADGKFYDSREEALVANALFESGLKYHKNTKYFYYNESEYFIPDFVVGDNVIVEYFGLIRKGCKSSWSIVRVYKERWQRKLKYFVDRPEIKFVALYPEDLESSKVIDKIKEMI